MLRALIRILVAWPLLMPQGVCVCQFLRGECVPSSCQQCVTAGDQSTDTDCHCHHPDNQTKDCSAGQGHPRPADLPHPPGCPARQTAVDYSKLVPPQGSRPVSTLDALAGISCFQAVPLSRAAVNQAAAIPGSSYLPIYIDHCALLI
jgi:hypothetical protein